MNKVKKPMMKVSVGSLFYSVGKTVFDPEDYANIVESPIIKNVGASEEGETVKVHASGTVYDSITEVTGTTLEIEVIAFDPEDVAALRGESIEDNGLIFGGGAKERPYTAIGFPKIKTNNKIEYVWYPKCKLIENTDEIATKEETFSEQTDTLTFEAMPFNDNEDVSVKLDTETEAGADVTLEQFFNQVIVKKEDLTEGA